MDYPDYLYHYTSVESMISIIKNKTIRFKSLIQVDDLEEAKTKDLGDFGKYCYVSCWSEGDDESIPLWSMYSNDMKGVRLRFPTFPFIKYNYKIGEYNFTENCESYIDYKKIYHDSKVTVMPNNPKLIKIEYTDNEEFLFPKINTTDMAKNKHQIQTNKIGKFKRTCWNFQKEWRYLILFLPFSEKELINNIFKVFTANFTGEQIDSSMQELMASPIRPLLNINTQIPYDYFDLHISQKLIDNIEITMGPKMTLEGKEIVKLAANEYCKNAKIKDSTLKIK